MKIESKSLKETEEVARKFLDLISKREETKGAQVAGLSGDLGAGKTTFVQAIARILGVKENVTSPTFVIMKIYPLSDQVAKWSRLIHIDAYRLENGEELMKLNFAEVAGNQKNLILIEWTENVSSALPKNSHQINFKFIDDQTREIEF
jgi:tRNA threonylcarbamoyladenosine biosynthesis protein TsaE